MKYIKYPDKNTWAQILKRPTIESTDLFNIVGNVIKQVRNGGDNTIKQLEKKFDSVELDKIKVTEEEFNVAEQQVPQDLKDAIISAHQNISTFHKAQAFEPIKITTAPGVTCEQRSVAIENVGLYVPGGTAPLFSTVLMLATPAHIAGCKNIILCTPPRRDGTIHPAILFAARIAGVTQIFKIGGAQAIAAMAYGTETVPKTDKIFGPGNQYVTAAKQLVSLNDVAIDMPAGPSEVEVLADESCNPAFVAADLLSQAEHGTDSQSILVSTSDDVITKTIAEIERQSELLPRQELINKSLDHSLCILVNNIEEAIDITNTYAPEHLVIATKNYHDIANKITHAGSIFLGNYSCESAGDYASGTNHTLPTKGYARAYSGLNLDSFCRKITLQEISREGIKSIGETVSVMAKGEQLTAHQRAMTIRMEEINK